jgi:hypothetical protein
VRFAQLIPSSKLVHMQFRSVRLPGTHLGLPPPLPALQRPPHFGGGHGGFNRGGPPEVALGPAVDVEQLAKDIERSQVGGRLAAGSGSPVQGVL